MVASPLTGLVTSLNGLIGGLARQLQAMADEGLVGGDAPAEEPTAEETSEEKAEEAPAAEEPAAEADAETSDEDAAEASDDKTSKEEE